MDNTKYQIFISSTYTDLVESRLKVRDTILGMYHFPVGMEMFSADDDEQWQIIKETIDSSDYYILIIGHRYGSLAEDGISYTEKEFDYAKLNNIPILSFIRERNVSIRPDDMECKPDKIKKLNHFIEKAKLNKLCDFWTTPDELAGKVSIALYKIFKRKPRVGWKRNDNINFVEITAELTKLGQENRKLRIENESLRGQIDVKKPLIMVELNKCEVPKFKYHINHKLEEEYIKNIKIDEVEEHLMGYISKEDVDNYNNALPNNEELNAFNNEIMEYYKAKDNAESFDIMVYNDGKIKANQVYIEIQFPDEIKVIDSNYIDNHKKPESPLLPQNPLRKAEKAYMEKVSGIISIQKVINSFTFLNNYNKFPIINGAMFNKNVNSWIEDNTLTIKLSNLLHTRNIAISEEYKIVPLKPGNYEVKVSIICEEYEEKDINIIPIIVEMD